MIEVLDLILEALIMIMLILLVLLGVVWVGQLTLHALLGVNADLSDRGAWEYSTENVLVSEQLEAKDKIGNWEQDYPKDHHYVLLLDCGHYVELHPNWNIVIDGGSPNPKEALCKRCGSPVAVMAKVKGFAKVEHDAR